MARFHYAMQSILDIKLKMENQAKQEFSAARASLDREEELLDGLMARRQEYSGKAASLLSGDLNVRDIEENRNAILVMDGFVADQTERVSRAEQVLERAREKLTLVMQERKTHENLKEKAFQQFLEDEKRREGKEVDELTSYVYGRRKSAEGREEARA